jgi:hypothetical protein
LEIETEKGSRFRVVLANPDLKNELPGAARGGTKGMIHVRK